MVAIPNCIAWSIADLMRRCVGELIPQSQEIYEDRICSKSKSIIYGNVHSRLVILDKIESIIPYLNAYYDKENYIWKEEKYKGCIADHKKRIDDFVSWLRSLEGDEKIYNINDWSY